MSKSLFRDTEARTKPIRPPETIGIRVISRGKARVEPFTDGRFVPLVSDEIQVHIISQAVEAKANAEYLKAEAAD